MRRVAQARYARPRAVRLIVANYAAGGLAGAAFTAALVATNTQGLRDLIVESTNPWVPAVLLTLQMSFTTAAQSAGVAVMRLVARH